MWDFSLKNFDDVWAMLIQFGLLLIFLIIGDVCRKKIPFIKRFHIPAALMGGLLFFVVKIILKEAFHYELVNEDFMKIVTYHCLAIGFIAMTLKVNKHEKKDGLGTLSIQNGLITGGTYMIQAVFGMLVVFIFVWAGKNIFYDTGVLLPLAFGQGPGNALTWDMNFSSKEFMDALGAEGILNTNGSLGLTLASVGFIVASVIGVIYINICKKKGLVKEQEVKTVRTVDEFIGEEEIEDNNSIDKLSIQIGLIAICYAMTFGIMCLLSLNSFTNTFAWGFNFIFGVLSATLLKAILKLFRKKKIANHNFINNYQMDRISGFAFDLMIIAGVSAIDINAIKDYIWIIVALSIVGTIVTFIYIKFLTKICFKGYENEMFLINFGTLTGTASNGIILLREVDPNYKTPASTIFVISQFTAMVAVAPLLLLLNFSAVSMTHALIAMGIFGAIFVVYTVLIIVLSRKYKQTLSKKKN